jgi:DNA-directed RNA polymerase specialized sigma24 family protein
MLRMIDLASDQPAWDALRAELYRFVARRVPAADADDVVQEAMLRIHRGLPNLRAQGAVLGWLYQVTRHALVDHLRAMRPSDELDDELSTTTAADDSSFRALAHCLAAGVAQHTAH